MMGTDVPVAQSKAPARPRQSRRLQHCTKPEPSQAPITAAAPHTDSRPVPEVAGAKPAQSVVDLSLTRSVESCAVPTDSDCSSRTGGRRYKSRAAVPKVAIVPPATVGIQPEALHHPVERREPLPRPETQRRLMLHVLSPAQSTSHLAVALARSATHVRECRWIRRQHDAESRPLVQYTEAPQCLSLEEAVAERRIAWDSSLDIAAQPASPTPDWSPRAGEQLDTAEAAGGWKRRAG
eukprot:GGOE01053632.1.p2 GENE.GGOE01053632.1~~GGOE01053632.1.p2  ORF type:complete len:237 (+),score=27.82 GGOE01053632.1:106-816(+)